MLPAATDCRTAYEQHAAAVRRELTSNKIIAYKVAFGDIDAAFAKAAHVLHEDLWQHRGAGHSIEGRGILAEVSDRETQVWASTQKAHDLRYAFADYIHLDENRLRVATPDVGGGFGPKLCVYPEDVAVVAAAILLHRPVKWIEDRREHFTNAVHERDQYWAIEIAADADGRVRGVRGRLIHDVGAYALQDVNLPYNSASTLTGPYMIAALAMDVIATHTNKTPVSSVRGAGYPQAAFAMERLLDRLAHELKLDRAELRRRNLIPAEKMPYLKPLKTRAGEQVQYDSGDYPACQAEVLQTTGLGRFRGPSGCRRAHRGRYLGMGLAHGVKGTGRGPFEFGGVRVSPTGGITVSTGAAPWGKGFRHGACANLCRSRSAFEPRMSPSSRAIRQRHRSALAVSPAVKRSPRARPCSRGAGRRRQGAQARQPCARSRRGRPRTRRRRSPRRRRSATFSKARRTRAHTQRRAGLRLSYRPRPGS